MSPSKAPACPPPRPCWRRCAWLAVMAAKNGQRLSLVDWAQNYSWLAAVYLMSAAVAGVLAINARQFGPAVVVLAAAVASAVLALVHYSLNRQEADHQAQEARIAEAQGEAALTQQRFTAAFTHAAIGMAIVRPDGSIHQVNQALCALLASAETSPRAAWPRASCTTSPTTTASPTWPTATASTNGWKWRWSARGWTTRSASR